MGSKFLITRCRHDTTTAYLFNWNEELAEFAKGKNIKFSDFCDEKASRSNIEKFLAKQAPKLVLFNGHGNSREICGHKNEPLIIEGKNEELLKNKIVYALACEAAKELGKSAVKKECSAFIGYEGPFSFVRERSRECNPAKDRFAEPFKEASNTIALSLIKGSPAGEAIEKGKNKHDELIKKYSASDAEPAWKDIRFWLFWNQQFLKLLGNQSAKFS